MEPDPWLIFSRGSRARTRDLWFWRPPLYQLSYTPPSVYCVSRSSYLGCPRRDPHYGIRARLFRLPVIGVLAAPRAELAERQAIRIVLLVLRRRVVPVFTLLACHANDNPNVAGHLSPFSIAKPPSGFEPETPILPRWCATTAPQRQETPGHDQGAIEIIGKAIGMLKDPGGKWAE
jgi:hypothetical protein